MDRAEHERLEGRTVHAALLVQPVGYKRNETPTTRTLKMPKQLWYLASEGDLAGVKAAIEAGANLEAKDPVCGMHQQCTRPSPPPPSHSVLTTRLLPHAPPH